MSVTKAAYSGSTPGADSNDYVLFSTSVAFPRAQGYPPGYTDLAGVKRVRISLAHSHNGTFKLQRSSNGEASAPTWTTINDEAITAAASERSFYDAHVAGLRDWRVIWTNGGSAQTTWVPEITLDEDVSPVA